ncbi:MAG: PepSY domain-containing protein [Pelotomaculum sp.]|uniref:Hypothetical membrane protein n=1 Tax=Pelotomaculum thermopropionicum (strain DSM 13744 / JCM 10971 / SI) TaxID=370438 RepID=A5D6A0_PELTS|nr:PepSY domain-containing protein [Pelotomaculum sp.]BAF58221.1 hypothetical membrane protein [Pelotomaculum thermopropionicum SI]
MKKCRQLHLWIGLFTSVLILIESVTGLLMVEPWLIGANRPQAEQRVQLEKAGAVDFAGDAAAYGRRAGAGAGQGRNAGSAGRQNSLMAFVRGLHSGKIGNTDLSIFLDIVAVAMIVLTTTGIIMSVNILRAQARAKKRI